MQSIRKKHHKLIADYHPDRLSSKGLPDAFNEFAHQKAQEINAAFMLIEKSRGH